MKERRPIFYDAERVRWRRTRRVLEISGVLLTALLAYFFVNIAVSVELPAGLLPARPAYHAAAVIAANLGMTLLAEAVDILERAGVDRGRALQGLTGLVRGGLEASLDAGLPAALTGPVTRGDVGTLAVHVETLRADPELLAAYLAVSRLALRQARRDGRPVNGAEAVADILKENQ